MDNLDRLFTNVDRGARGGARGGFRVEETGHRADVFRGGVAAGVGTRLRHGHQKLQPLDPLGVVPRDADGRDGKGKPDDGGGELSPHRTAVQSGVALISSFISAALMRYSEAGRDRALAGSIAWSASLVASQFDGAGGQSDLAGEARRAAAAAAGLSRPWEGPGEALALAAIVIVFAAFCVATSDRMGAHAWWDAAAIVAAAAVLHAIKTVLFSTYTLAIPTEVWKDVV